ncbi:SprT family zinc-dependent metalloprotease [Guyparkeria halophila]|uniref:SprT family zinc-dependent metalloprotease n=1 Tax=Guyparkeria halophila TaxID=47960 RepID=A0ABZ0YVL9_9GAMM|nr:SprT family zinc-dependent metalloprotease [Guyparkeria halophila]WQH15262.1 SprT family zinc-dependent metalloprotease [Guyparkeria halophila]
MTRHLFAPRHPRGPQTLDHSLGTIRVERKAIRHLYLRLDARDGSLRVSAPKRVSDRAIRAFVTSRAGWIATQRERRARRPAILTEANLPDSIHLLGQEHVISWRATDDDVPRSERLVIAEGHVHLTGPDQQTARQRLREHCRQLLKGHLDARVSMWASRMSLPQPESRVRRMKTRWGTCNIQARRIWLNLELARMPLEAIDLVIVHELAHLIERGHNRRFYAVMDDAYPDWRRWETTLSEYGIIGL